VEENEKTVHTLTGNNEHLIHGGHALLTRINRRFRHDLKSWKNMKKRSDFGLLLSRKIREDLSFNRPPSPGGDAPGAEHFWFEHQGKLLEKIGTRPTDERVLSSKEKGKRTLRPPTRREEVENVLSCNFGKTGAGGRRKQGKAGTEQRRTRA